MMTSRATTTEWFTAVKPDPRQRVRLFCFPYAGGTAHIFREWPEGLPKSVQVCTANLPGRGSRIREQPFGDIHELVERVGREIRPFLDMPFAFFGHSMGAMISFELTRYLRRELGVQPLQLFVSGRRAPQLPVTEPTSYDMPEEVFKEKLRTLNGTPAEVLEHPELMELMLPLLRADFSVVETYDYREEPPLDVPITVFGGLQDHKVGRDVLVPWREQTTANVTVRMLPGDHFFLNTVRPTLLGLLSKELERLAAAAV
jgi:medium-chain acyl-[acyl-carrier-protein] hydrolase